jgi:hypothetical protein
LNDQVACIIDRVPRAEQANVTRALLTLHDAYLAELEGDETAAD